MGYDPNTETIYYILQLFSQIANNIGTVLPSNMSRASQLYSSVLRLSKVLKAEEMTKFESVLVTKPYVLLRNVYFDLGHKEILKGISMKIDEPSLTVVTGAVGSGKTTLLKLILHEYQLVKEGRLYTVNYRSALIL